MKRQVIRTRTSTGKPGWRDTAGIVILTAALLGVTGCTWNTMGPGPAQTPPDALPLASDLRTGRPTLLELGSVKCIPCKMMAPVLDELKRKYKGRLEVIFIDVWKDRAPGQRHRIRVIPTQIFFDAAGKELYRHEGFLAKEDILGKWKELGIDLSE